MYHLAGLSAAALLLTIAVLPSTVHGRQALSPPRLPAPLKQTLDRRFGGWIYNETGSEILKWFSAEKRGANPNLIAGDFDGNGLRDYAIQIITLSSGQRERRVVVYLRRGKGYRHRTLATGEPTGELFLLLMPRGTKDYSYSRHRHFRYKLDSIGVFSEKGGSSYFYKNGRFVSEITSD